MGRYLIRRLIQAIPVLIGATFLIYWLSFKLPGDPIQALAGEKKADPLVAAMLREKYHLNDSFLSQYWNYISNLFQGNFGETLTGRSVWDKITEAFPYTMNLAIVAFLIEPSSASWPASWPPCAAASSSTSSCSCPRSWSFRSRSS